MMMLFKSIYSPFKYLFFQAFVTTKHMQTMDREGRVLVTRFAYSSMKTIPKVIFTST